MAVSKRTRFEVLRRDNYTCRYCGAKAPDVVLEADHVTPVALGGSDKPDNLVAACVDCNAGKSSTIPDADTVADVSTDQIRWSAAIKAAAEAMIEDTHERVDRHSEFVTAWKSYGDTDLNYLASGWAKSLDYWLGAGLPLPVLLDCLDIAMGNRNVTYPNVFAYMGGIARKRIEALHEAAAKILEDDDGA